ncbi:winged helix-turn-helix domain-containing protein [Streptomyces sp. NPDC013178]|uniref:winged helix-turn-helix domain-containing protein n=1 Tax=Streptomyces sp. NPDC013178 TaxID=3155118 RepID=UPI0033DA6FB2
MEQELRLGPGAYGFTDGQRWTLKRVKTLIDPLFHVGYTVQGVWKLLKRHAWSCQVPVRQAVERDEEAIGSVEGASVATGKTMAADLGAHICFEDETGQGLRPPKGRTWAPRGARPVVRGRGKGHPVRVEAARCPWSVTTCTFTPCLRCLAE